MCNGAIFHEESMEFYPQTNREYCRSVKKKRIYTLEEEESGGTLVL